MNTIRSSHGSVTSTDGTTIAYTAVGKGPAVVVVDGAMSYRGPFNATQDALAAALADRYTVYTYDRRGRGESNDLGNPEAPVAKAVAEQVQDLTVLVDHAGGETALLGFSSGAVLCLEAALAGLSVHGLALYEPPFVVTDDRQPVTPDYRDRVLRAVAEERPGDAVALFFTETVAMPGEYVEPMRVEPFWEGMERLAPTLAHDAAVMNRSMSGDRGELDRYAAVQVPTLVMNGGNSDHWIAAGAQAIAEVLPAAEHRVVPDQDHDVSAEALLPHLEAWLPTVRS